VICSTKVVFVGGATVTRLHTIRDADPGRTDLVE